MRHDSARNPDRLPIAIGQIDIRHVVRGLRHTSSLVTSQLRPTDSDEPGNGIGPEELRHRATHVGKQHRGMKSNNDPRTEGLQLSFQSEEPMAEPLSLGGFAAWHVELPTDEAFEYSWSDNTLYLALHDIQLDDGEASVEGGPRTTLRDLRGTLTMLPPGHAIKGWSKPARRRNSFTAMTFDPSVVGGELEERFKQASTDAAVYFRSGVLEATMRELAGLLSGSNPDRLHAETLCFLATVELLKEPKLAAFGTLSPKQLRDVTDYIAANLHRQFELAELAGVAGLSRFHFARAFKRSTGRSPHQYVTSRRIDEAKQLLEHGNLRLDAVASRVGFGSVTQLRRTFAKVTGLTLQRFQDR